MKSDEAGDVTKALRAFGAPALRDQCAGQGQARVSQLVALPQQTTPIKPRPQSVAHLKPLPSFLALSAMRRAEVPVEPKPAAPGSAQPPTPTLVEIFAMLAAAPP